MGVDVDRSGSGRASLPGAVHVARRSVLAYPTFQRGWPSAPLFMSGEAASGKLLIGERLLREQRRMLGHAVLSSGTIV